MESENYIDLGEKIKMPEMAIAEISVENEKTHYPCLYFSGKNSLKTLPKEGTAIIKYKKVMEREETRSRDGKEETCYCTELEIHSIKAGENEESEEEENDEPSNEDAIETGLKAASTTSTEEED